MSALLLDAAGRPIMPEEDDSSGACPGCGAGSEKRTAANGFGTPIMVCTQCGHTFEERG